MRQREEKEDQEQRIGQQVGRKEPTICVPFQVHSKKPAMAQTAPRGQLLPSSSASPSCPKETGNVQSTEVALPSQATLLTRS